MSVANLVRARTPLLLAYALCALLFMYLYFATTDEWPQATAAQLVRFEAAAPFQQRILAPLLLRAGVAVGLPLVPLYKALVWASVVGLLVAMRALLRTFGAGWADWGGLLVLYPLVWNSCVFGVFRYPSDVLAVALFACGLAVILQRRWAWLYAVAAVATLNRESAVLLVPALLLVWWGRERPLVLVAHAVALTALWAGLRLVVGQLVPGVGGAAFYPQVAANAEALLNPRVWPAYVLSFGGAWVAVALGWRWLPAALRRLFVLAPALVAIIAVVGNLHETRVYGELAPLVAAALGWVVVHERSVA